MELFAERSPDPRPGDAPLAWRMCPRNLDEFEGQEHLLGPGKPLREAILGDRLSSLILYGPPGTGKTALARLIAGTTGAAFAALNAVTAGVREIRRITEESETRRRSTGRKTILFVDEIHRFNKVQQDALLPDVEQGRVVLIGASTENPFFALVPALRSRSRILEFRPLGPEALRRILERALGDAERGLGGLDVRMTEEALQHIVTQAGGDARQALSSLESGVQAAGAGAKKIDFSLALAEAAVQKKALQYDRDGDGHYDTISAFIKSMRGSDPDAALHYLARMLEAGEDPRFVARRLVICASEDVGNADPRALLLAEAALRSVEKIGMPEARIILAQAVIYVAAAPKSNASYLAIETALSDIRSGRILPVPDALRDASYRGAGSLGRGRGYRYPHDEPGHFSTQSYLSEERQYYRPSDQGFERTLAERIATWRRMRRAAEGGARAGAGEEVPAPPLEHNRKQAAGDASGAEA